MPAFLFYLFPARLDTSTASRVNELNIPIDAEELLAAIAWGTDARESLNCLVKVVLLWNHVGGDLTHRAGTGAVLTETFEHAPQRNLVWAVWVSIAHVESFHINSYEIY